MTLIETISLLGALLGMIATLCSLIKPIINLNVSITHLNDITEQLSKNVRDYKDDAEKISNELASIKERITTLEVKLEGKQ